MRKTEEALLYHSQGRPGKIEVIPTKPVASQLDLSLAYSPGVAAPCLAIKDDPDAVDLYTARGNLVGVITNGTAVLGLGNIGPRAAKPVMEGKAVLFKRFADIDVFDLELDAPDPETFINAVRTLEPTFGGINLEDIKAPECFIIEKRLRELMSIPVFHDDQHGTAIISTAALLNALELQGKKVDQVQVTCIGAGAAATSCMHMWASVGVPYENITMFDVDGVVRVDRPGGVDEFRARFARPASDARRSLADCLRGADVMVGLSAGGLVTAEMVKTMADKPIIFALANPDPEIDYEAATAARPDAIVATGRSDFPNQVNNVLGFPYIFRGALDVRASTINEEMKVAAARALAELAHQEVSDDVLRAYSSDRMRFGPRYIIPKPFDTRVLYWVAPAVAEAAMKSGVARQQLDIGEYRERLYRKISPARRVLWRVTESAKEHPSRIVFPEGEHPDILRAAERLADAGIALPVLLGSVERIESLKHSLGLSLHGVSVLDHRKDPRLQSYADALWQKRQRQGVTEHVSRANLRSSRIEFALMMLDQGDAEGVVAGLRQGYPATIRPALQIIGVRPGVKRASGMYMIVGKDDVRFLADTTINIEPDAETLAETAILAAETVRDLGITPRVAMLSFSNFGDARHPASQKVAQATAIVKQRCPDLMIDGEMQADVALSEEARERYSFSSLKGSANVLIFPNLDAGNAAYKLLAASGRVDIVGPIVLGMRKAVNVLQQGSSVDAIIHVTAMTVARAVRLKELAAELDGAGASPRPA
jgi:malate dehydrogenase (oxaloacetate-decarboxylating)(NADP+)